MMTKFKPEFSLLSSGKYYQEAKKGSLDRTHPGMRILIKLALKSKKILDMGCGEGTRLNIISGKDAGGHGVDVSKKAVELAKNNFPKFKFIEVDLESIPYEDEYFDLVYCAYVLEHLKKPEVVIDEGVRVTKKGGKIVFIAPNHGSPNRASPVYKKSRYKKILNGFFEDIFGGSRQMDKLNWEKVVPVLDPFRYEMDVDTRVEPYIRTLILYLKNKGLSVEESLSCWSQELPNAKAHQRIFRILGKFDIYPFKYWGPHMVVVAER